MNAKSLTALLLSAVAACLTLARCDKADVQVDHLYIVASKPNVAPGDTVRLTLHAHPEDATAGFPKVDTIIWSSSDTTVATVDSKGTLIAKRFGSTVIKVVYGRFEPTKKIVVSGVAQVGDPHLLSFLLERFDTNHDGKLEGYEMVNTRGLDLTDIGKKTGGRVDMAGLDGFVNLQTLRIERMSMRGLDLASFRELEEVHIDACSLDTLDLRMNSKLRDVRIMGCPDLKAVILGSHEQFGPNNLYTFHCSRCDISEIDLSRCGRTLGDIAVDGNPRLATLDLSVDTMLHSVRYTCDVTNVIWPDSVDLDLIIQICE